MGGNGSLGSVPQVGGVLLVNGLPDIPGLNEMLFTLFGVYGDVLRVKILYNKKETCLIQFRDANQAGLAMGYLNNVEFYGSTLNIQKSKHPEVSLRRSDTEDKSELTRDYSRSNLHRFKILDSKNARNIAAPNPVLHVSSLHSGITEQELVEVFSQHQRTVAAVQFIGPERRMALVQFVSTAHALHALVELHNYQLGDKQMKITFSNRAIKQDETMNTSAGTPVNL